MFDGHSLGGFTVSGADGQFVKVSAKIINKTQVRLSTKGITEPKTVRYAWQQNPADANLTNIERLPASPFEIKVD
jgi:sialate O-acetylesterase